VRPDRVTRGRVALDAAADLPDPRAFAALEHRLYRQDWVVYAKRPFAGAAQVSGPASPGALPLTASLTREYVARSLQSVSRPSPGPATNLTVGAVTR